AVRHRRRRASRVPRSAAEETEEDPMKNNAIDALVVETHNYGKTVAFWKGLGFQVEFETDHASGQLRHPGGGPYVFVREVSAAEAVQTYPILTVDDPGAFEAPSAGTVTRPFA